MPGSARLLTDRTGTRSLWLCQHFPTSNDALRRVQGTVTRLHSGHHDRSTVPFNSYQASLNIVLKKTKRRYSAVGIRTGMSSDMNDLLLVIGKLAFVLFKTWY